MVAGAARGCVTPDGVPTSKPASRAGFRGIGATGFEPATARPPAECATRLRHAPWCAESRRLPSGPFANVCSYGGAQALRAREVEMPLDAFACLRTRALRGEQGALYQASGRAEAPGRPGENSIPYRVRRVNTRARTAERPIRSCSSSTTCATRLSISAPTSESAPGTRSWPRWRSARSCVRTAIATAPRDGATHCGFD